MVSRALATLGLVTYDDAQPAFPAVHHRDLPSLLAYLAAPRRGHAAGFLR